MGFWRSQLRLKSCPCRRCDRACSSRSEEQTSRDVNRCHNRPRWLQSLVHPRLLRALLIERLHQWTCHYHCAPVVVLSLRSRTDPGRRQNHNQVTTQHRRFVPPASQQRATALVSNPWTQPRECVYLPAPVRLPSMQLLRRNGLARDSLFLESCPYRVHATPEIVRWLSALRLADRRVSTRCQGCRVRWRYKAQQRQRFAVRRSLPGIFVAQHRVGPGWRLHQHRLDRHAQPFETRRSHRPRGFAF